MPCQPGGGSAWTDPDNGSGEFIFRGVFSDPAVVQQIINNPAAFYFNVHSPTNSGGFSRGQLVRVQ